MEQAPYYSLIATLHGITGLIIFLTGILQFLLKKGGKWHRLIGRIYFFSWFSILATGAYIGSLVIVAIVFLGFYLCITGIRAAALRGKPFELIDKSIVIFAAMVVLFMIVSAIFLVIDKYYTYAIIAGFFSILYSWVIARDVIFILFNKRTYKKDYGKLNWYVSHLTRMQFSFVTAVGAFTAVQNVFGNDALNFILPALLGFVVIKRSTKYFLDKANIVAK